MQPDPLARGFQIIHSWMVRPACSAAGGGQPETGPCLQSQQVGSIPPGWRTPLSPQLLPDQSVKRHGTCTLRGCMAPSIQHCNASTFPGAPLYTRLGKFSFHASTAVLNPAQNLMLSSASCCVDGCRLSHGIVGWLPDAPSHGAASIPPKASQFSGHTGLGQT